MTSPRFGGPWTEEKLAILRAYLDAYTTALKNQPFTLIYVDGFPGAGSYMELDYYSEDYLEFREGSPLIALEVDDKSFDRLIFIDEDAVAAEALLNLKSEHPGRQIEGFPRNKGLSGWFCGVRAVRRGIWLFRSGLVLWPMRSLWRAIPCLGRHQRARNGSCSFMQWGERSPGQPVGPTSRPTVPGPFA